MTPAQELTSLQLLKPLLRSSAYDAWITDQQVRGEKVAVYRRYYDGDHDADMTADMRRLLRVKKSNQGSSQFTDNLMQIIIDTMADRCNLDRIEGDNEAINKWAQEILDANRVDGMNNDVHSGAIRDADTFVMVSYDNDEARVKLTHELAFDGRSGILMLYKSDDWPEPEAAIKIWNIQSESGSIVNTIRINIYWPDKVQKFISRDGGNFAPYVDEYTDAKGEAPWVTRDGEPLGIPVIHFRNRGRQNYGLSELENAIPQQDALNRLQHSLVMTAELTAFQNRIAKGFNPPADMTPGSWIVIGGEGLTKDDVAEADVLPTGDVSQYLAAIQHFEHEIMRVTRTPAPEFMGSDAASGEALKQREIGLLGKVRRFQVKAGNAWENVMDMAWKIEDAYGAKRPPDYTRFYARWTDPEIRNEQTVIDNALKLQPVIGDKEALRIVAPIYGWDETKIEEILSARQMEQSQKLTTLAGQLPTFGEFDDFTTANEPQQAEVAA